MTETITPANSDVDVSLHPRRVRPGIAADATELIGNTPLVRLSRFSAESPGEVVAQVGSVHTCLLGQGSYRGFHDRGGRTAGTDRAGEDHHRGANQWQHRNRSGVGRGRERLPVDLDHAR